MAKDKKHSGRGQKRIKHVNLLYLANWVDQHLELIAKQPKKAALAVQAEKELGFEVSKHALEDCLRAKNLWYSETSSGKPRQQLRIRTNRLASILLAFHNAIQEMQPGVKVLEDSTLEMLERVAQGLGPQESDVAD